MSKDFDKFHVNSENEVSEKVQFLEEFVAKKGRGSLPPERFLKFLFLEMMETEYPDWAQHCSRILKQEMKSCDLPASTFFEDGLLAWELMSDRPVEQKILLLDLCLDYIGAEHGAIFEWLESQLDNQEPKVRSACRKRLDHLNSRRKSGVTVAGLPGALNLSGFMELTAQLKLQWLEAAEDNQDRMDSLLRWGLQALATEQDRFVLSRLARLIPLVFHSRMGESTRMPMLVHGLLLHEDARVRANTLEGLWQWAASEHYGKLVLAMAEQAMKDVDPRVRTGAVRLMFSRDDKKALSIIRQMIQDASNQEELSSISWLLQSVQCEDLYHNELETASARLQAMQRLD